MHRTGAVGYIAVDVLNNATVCNEAVGLIAEGIPLDIVSVRRFDQPTYYQEETLSDLAGRIHTLYPLRWQSVVWALVLAPWVFGFRFWVALAKALGCPAEGWKQKLRVLIHFVPALCVALRWRKRGVTHVHAHWAHTATTIAMHAAELLGVGFSFTGHANDLFVHRVALRAKARRARFVVCISEFHRQLFLKLGADRFRLPVVYCGIDTSRFRAATALPRSEPSRPRILGVGRLVEKKGFHLLIAACAGLRDRGFPFECLIAGSGPEQDRLQRVIADYNLQNQISVTGQPVLQEDLGPLLRTASVVALPCIRDRDGDMDGLPQVLIEAMACDVPVVSTRLVGIPDLVRDGWNGKLVTAGGVPDLTDALAEFLGNPNEAAAMGQRAGSWVRSHFDRSEAVRRLADLFLHAAATQTCAAPLRRWDAAPETPAIVPDEEAFELTHAGNY